MRVIVRFYPWPETADRPAIYTVVGHYARLADARAEFPYLRPERSRAVLEGLDAWRAHTWAVVGGDRGPGGLYAAVPTPVAAPRRGPRGPAEIYWPRTAVPGEMRVLARGELVECHVCGEPVVSVGHHARWQHKMSPAKYRERFGLNRRTPLCAPAYSQKLWHRNRRLQLASVVLLTLL